MKYFYPTEPADQDDFSKDQLSCFNRKAPNRPSYKFTTLAGKKQSQNIPESANTDKHNAFLNFVNITQLIIFAKT